jgi:hypothetical protein
MCLYVARIGIDCFFNVVHRNLTPEEEKCHQIENGIVDFTGN